MKSYVLAGWLIWQGFYAGVEQTAYWREPFRQPGLTASAVGLVGVGRWSVRGVYLQPLQRGGYGPALQLGISTRIF